MSVDRRAIQTFGSKTLLMPVYICNNSCKGKKTMVLWELSSYAENSDSTSVISEDNVEFHLRALAT